jgi:hypothetical protein
MNQVAGNEKIFLLIFLNLQKEKNIIDEIFILSLEN